MFISCFSLRLPDDLEMLRGCQKTNGCVLDLVFDSIYITYL
uniref:Uncharacterized protein n=1 Tax=Rhizophora mucronata TaxID=61149 RepID=A0A2P2P250_RHIMU